MRRLVALAVPLGLLAAPAGAQHWNDSGPGRDLLSSTIGEFDSFRQRTPGAQGIGAGTPAGVAQHWNNSGPGRDLLSSTIGEFDSFRQRTPGAQGIGAGTPAGVAQQARPPIPILDWVPPPPQPTTSAAPRRPAPQRQVVRRSPAPVMRDPAPLPTSAPMPATIPDGRERSLAERERDLDRLRRILEEDRLRHQQARHPQPR